MPDRLAASCHFLRLPRELRDEIYTHVFQFHTLKQGGRSGEDRLYSYPQILQTCRQIYDEALPLLVVGNGNTLTFEIWDGYWRTIDGEVLYEGWRGWPGWHLTINGHQMEQNLPLSEENARLDVELCEKRGTGLPRCLQYVRKLKIHIVNAVEQPRTEEALRKTGWIPQLIRTNHVLFLFAVALSGKISLEELEIFLEDRPGMVCKPVHEKSPKDRTEALTRGLYPLLSSVSKQVSLKVSWRETTDIDCRASLSRNVELSDPRSVLQWAAGILPDGGLAEQWRDHCEWRRLIIGEQGERRRGELYDVWKVDSFGLPGYYDVDFAYKSELRLLKTMLAKKKGDPKS